MHESGQYAERGGRKAAKAEAFRHPFKENTILQLLPNRA